PVLDAAARVERLDLDVDRHAQPFRHAPQTHQRRPADRLQDGFLHDSVSPASQRRPPSMPPLSLPAGIQGKATSAVRPWYTLLHSVCLSAPPESVERTRRGQSLPTPTHLGSAGKDLAQ